MQSRSSAASEVYRRQAVEQYGMVITMHGRLPHVVCIVPVPQLGQSAEDPFHEIPSNLQTFNHRASAQISAKHDAQHRVQLAGVPWHRNTGLYLAYRHESFLWRGLGWDHIVSQLHLTSRRY